MIFLSLLPHDILHQTPLDLSKDAFDGVKTNIFLIQFTELFSYLIYSKYMQYRSSHCQRPSDTVRSIFISVHKLCVIISLKLYSTNGKNRWQQHQRCQKFCLLWLKNCVERINGLLDTLLYRRICWQFFSTYLQEFGIIDVMNFIFFNTFSFLRLALLNFL